MQPSLRDLIQNLPRPGSVTWIGVRPAKNTPMASLHEVVASRGSGLAGDRFQARSNKREVTFIQAEHIDAIASMTGRDGIDPALLRRNIVISGINLLALKDKQFRVGEAIFSYTGLAHPCSKMESVLGPGGYNAMRGHGGITTRIVESGTIQVGDRLMPVAGD